MVLNKNSRSLDVIVTLGPASLKPDVLSQIYSQGPCIFRLNGAHTDPEGLEPMVRKVKDLIPEARLMLDLPGNKVRLTGLSKPIRVVKDKTVTVDNKYVNYHDFYKNVKQKDIILAQDSTIMLEVISIGEDSIEFLSHSNGMLEDRRGFHLSGLSDNLPFFFEKDIKLMEAACKHGIDYLALSYVRNEDDISDAEEKIKSFSGPAPRLITKVETRKAVENLDRILKKTDHILIDRGDLSSEVGLQDLPIYQEKIIESATSMGKRVFLATQFLKNMQNYPIPLIAEVMDLHKTLKGNIHGIQLSEETAIGAYPVECVKYIFDAFKGICHQS